MAAATVYPSTHGNFKNGGVSTSSWILAGRTSSSGANTYYAWMAVDLSAYAGKAVTSVKLYIKEETGNSTTLPAGVGVSTAATYAAVSASVSAPAATANVADVEGAWTVFDVTGAWAQLKLGARYLCLGATAATYNTYKQFYSEEAAAGSRPYIVIAYEDGVARIDSGAALDMYTVWIDGGAAFSQYAPYIDNGSAWEQYGG